MTFEQHYRGINLVEKSGGPVSPSQHRMQGTTDDRDP